MGSFSLMHWVIVLLVVMLLFGGGRISGLMGDVAKGIKSFKKGMADDDDDVAAAKPATRIEGHRVPEQDAPGATSNSADEKTKA
ncbi:MULTISPECIES: twin-arginine translocase TatA/TatE family subunit [Sphingobium]|uniref:Sec-independent protein translocase protein TatA n=1 Tax=Sphingobium chungbukense TaxID=56193 RepID=A0A0M3AN22_9SPHN|nr:MULTISPECIES: twin-arginine translocase TatA/TatE family subunit [Sphingobium]KKW91230.1 preprotein translocase subunit SecA [Sphingobium chungbukense]PJG47535.1 twin-arginine translocase TatA/TatE family subunit [Sphingobium sp. LB126]